MISDQTLLEQYKKAYQLLLMGKSARVVQKDGRRVEYQVADAAKLNSEIARLEGILGQSRRRMPAGLY